MPDPILHIYAQCAPHDESFIVGNEAGLRKLVRIIELALEHHRATGLFTVSDGEGFCPIVVKTTEDILDQVRFAYTDDIYHMKGTDAPGPGDRPHLVPLVITSEQYRKLVKSDDEETIA